MDKYDNRKHISTLLDLSLTTADSRHKKSIAWRSSDEFSYTADHPGHRLGLLCARRFLD
jgi:hypothetical protein